MSWRNVEAKCRRCGKITDKSSANSKMLQNLLCDEVSGLKPLEVGWPSGLRDIHTCEDGGWGVTDVIGLSPEKGDS